MLKIGFYVLLTCLPLFYLSCNQQEQNAPATQGKVTEVIEKGDELMKSAVPERGLHYIDSVSRHDKWANDAMWEVYKAKANYYVHHVRDIEKRSIYIDSMFYAAGRSAENTQKQYRQTLFFKANLLEAEEEYEQAFKVYYDGRELSEKNGDWCNFAVFSHGLAVIRYRQQQFAQAIPYLLQAYYKLQVCKDSTLDSGFILPQGVLNTIGLCYQKTGKFGQAVKYYRMALQFIDKQRHKYPHKQDFMDISRAVVLGNLGGALSDMGDFTGAKQALKENIRINDRPGFEIEDAQTAKLKLARLYLNQQHLDSARNILDQVQSDIHSGRGKSIANTDVRKGWYKLEWEYHETTGNLKNAHRFLTLLHTLSDSLETAQAELRDADMDKVFITHKKDFELSMLQKDNEIKTISIIALTIVAVLCLGMVMIIWYFNKGLKKHVANLVRAQNQTKLAMDALENSHRENTRIIKIIAHDLRNPLGAIVSASDILAETISDGDDATMLSVIKSSSSNALHLANELMFINVTKEELIMQPVNLEDLVFQCVQMLTHQALQKDQTIKLTSEPAEVIGSYEKIWRVVSNLISNALKFSPAGKTVNVEVRQLAEHVAICVTDNGIGVPDHLKDQLFDMFTKASRKGTSGEESFGIGLAISKQIIEAHQGTLSFENNPQGGSTFTIRLPRKQHFD